jgi:transcriptional regulator with XRE-family HTH domain
MTTSAIATIIASRRNQKGMTQKELAESCQVDIRTIQRIESGEVNPRKHTLRLLSTILEYDLNNPNTVQVVGETLASKGRKTAIIAGLIFSINAIFVVYDLITGSLNPVAHIITTCIHIATCVLFYRGLYYLGKICRNQVIEISFFLLMIFLPLINIMELTKPWYFNPQATYAIFFFLCISVIASGIGMLSEGYKRSEHLKNRYYKPAGLAAIIQGAMFLSPDFSIVSAGLILSFFTNFVMIMILYSSSENKKEISQAIQEDKAFV